MSAPGVRGGPSGGCKRLSSEWDVPCVPNRRAGPQGAPGNERAEFKHPVPRIPVLSPEFPVDELRRNHGVAVVMDHWAGADGLWVEFFGRATSTLSLPARLAKKTGCALIPIFCIRTALGRYEVRLLPTVPMPDDPNWEFRTTKRLNDILEAQIRGAPEQWSWSHRRWRPQPSGL